MSQRKEITKEKREEQKKKKNTTYSQAATTNTNTTNNTSLNISAEKTETMLLCLLFAHIENAKRPGTYEEELNIMVDGKKLPKIKVPKVPNSREIINIPEVMTQIRETQNTHQTQK